MSRVVENAEKRITQNWGNGGHGGIDIGYSSNEKYNKVYPNCKGVIVEIVDGLDRIAGAQGVKSWGNYVLIKHPNGIHTRYAHLKKGIKVKVGYEVDEKSVIGIIGTSGNTYGRHLHFEVATGYSSNTRIDPTPYLTKAVYEEPLYPSDDLSPSDNLFIPEEQVFKFNVGDKVVFTGTLHRDAQGNGAGQTRTNFEATITKRANGSKPYNINNGLGWVAESDLKLIQSKPHTVTYIVKSGDTLIKIAKTYNTTYQKIAKDNGILNPDKIYVGQVLKIYQ